MRLRDQNVQIGMDALAAKEQKVADALWKIKQVAKQADGELTRFAKHTTEINTTPLEKYNRQLFVLEQALNRGKLSQDTYGRAVARAGAELRSASQQQDRTLGQDALGQIKNFAAGYLTLGSAVQLVANAFAHARQESQDALGSLRGLDDARRKLVQMADSPADLSAMLARADQAAAASGVDRATAYDVLFQAKSFGFEADYEKVLAANEVIRPDAGAQLAGKVSTMFGGKISGMQAINMALAAGKPSEVDAESIAGSLAMALEGGRRVGATPDETFAWVSALSAAFKSPLVAADRIKAITNRAAATPALRTAGGMTEIMKRLKAMPEDERSEILKNDQETNAAYEAMLEFYGKQQEIEAAVRAAREGTGTARDPLSLGMAIAGATPQTQSSLLSRQGEVGNEVARENALSGTKAARDKVLAGGMTNAYQLGLGAAQRYGMSLGGGLADTLGVGPERARWFQATGGYFATALTLNKSSSTGESNLGAMNAWFEMSKLMAEQNQILEQIRDRDAVSGAMGRAVAGAAAGVLN